MPLSPTPEPLVLACHITGVYDVNRNHTLPDNDYELVREWADSIASLGLRGILFHNSFTDETCAAHQTESVRFVRTNYNSQFNPNVYRYFVYRDFLQANAHEISSLFVTDSADVVVVMNPFVQSVFVDHPTALFCGDEPKPLNNEWMKNHAAHLRSRIADYADYEARFAQDTLLNCGIIGGSVSVMQSFIEKLCGIHQRYNVDNNTAYTGDMGAFNYLVRTQFNADLVHGPPVNTQFKAYESTRTDCWFRHK